MKIYAKTIESSRIKNMFYYPKKNNTNKKINVLEWIKNLKFEVYSYTSNLQLV